MSLDGISLEGNPLKIRRPKDYVAPPAETSKEKYIPGIVSTNVADTEFKIFIGGLPSYLNEVRLMRCSSITRISFQHLSGTSQRAPLFLWSSALF
jgi:hypothetical protein